MKPLFKALAIISFLYGCNDSVSTKVNRNGARLPLENSAQVKRDSVKVVAVKEDTTPLPPEHYHKKGYEIGFELMDSEKLGDIWIGMAKEQVVKLLGQPESKSDTSIDQVDGLLYQAWSYKKKGISLSMEGENYSKLEISDITITAPCTYRLKRRIGIGSTAQEVKKAYPKALDKEDKVANLIVLGSFYGGIQLTIHNNKVDTLFIGATAE